jgi:hypothetical protein
VSLWGNPNATVAIPLPQYQDGAIADLADVIVFVKPIKRRKNWNMQATSLLVYATYNDGGTYIQFEADQGEWETSFRVMSMAFRPDISVPVTRSSVSKVKSKY